MKSSFLHASLVPVKKHQTFIELPIHQEDLIESLEAQRQSKTYAQSNISHSSKFSIGKHRIGPEHNESQSVITSIKSQSNTVHRGFFTAQRRFLIVIAVLIGIIVIGGIIAVVKLM
ncbi:unnamed protein product, partial [Rotaria socialis]